MNRQPQTTMKKLDNHLYLKWVFGILFFIFVAINWNLIIYNQGLFWMVLIMILYIVLDWKFFQNTWNYLTFLRKNK